MSDIHYIDDEQVELLKDLVRNPLDIPSLERQVWDGAVEPFLSAGYTWIDKPHRVLDDAIREIRQLRALCIDLMGSERPCTALQGVGLCNRTPEPLNTLTEG